KRRQTISYGDWSSDVCSSDLGAADETNENADRQPLQDGDVAVLQHHPLDLPRGGAKSHADADLARAERHGVRLDPEEADHGEQRSEERRGGEERSSGARSARE